MRSDIVIYNLLKNNEAVDAITTQIYPNVVPVSVSAQTTPAVTYTKVVSEPVNSKTIEVNTNFDTIQINCFHKSYDTVQNLADVIVTALHGASGTVSVGGNDYKYKNVINTQLEDLGFDEDNNVYQVALDFSIQMYV